jgi:hypothetical protein
MQMNVYDISFSFLLSYLILGLLALRNDSFSTLTIGSIVALCFALLRKFAERSFFESTYFYLIALVSILFLLWKLEDNRKRVMFIGIAILIEGVSQVLRVLV